MRTKLLSLLSLLALSVGGQALADNTPDPMAKALGLRETYVTVEGARIHAVEGGNPQAPAVVFIHGFPDSWKLFRKQIPAFVAAGYRPVAIDLRGFGLSSRPADLEQYKINTSVQDVLSVMDALSIQKAAIVGHDWGGFVGWLLAANHPNRVTKLVSLTVGHPAASSKIKFTAKDFKNLWYHSFFQKVGIAEFILSNDSFALFRDFVHNHGEADSWVAELSRPADENGIPALTAALNEFRANSDEVMTVFPQITPPVTVPVLGLLSKGDLEFVREDMMTKSAEFCLAGFKYQRISAPSHWSTLDRPKEVNQAILKFLK